MVDVPSVPQPQPPHPPRAPTDNLRQESFRILSYLLLIYEFKPWLVSFSSKSQSSPLRLLWETFLYGAPLCMLLDLLGAPTPEYLVVDSNFNDDDSDELSLEGKEKYLTNFVQRIQLLEVLGRLSYGEVLKVDDFVHSTNASFTRVLQTVNRVLHALRDCYPGLFAVAHGAQARRASIKLQLLDTEQAHISNLLTVVAAASKLQDELEEHEPRLEGFLVNCTRLCQFHGHILSALEEAVLNEDEQEDWEQIFSFQTKVARVGITGTYRSICANYLGITDFLQSIRDEPILGECAETILSHISGVLSRVSEFQIMLQAILDVTSPTTPQAFESICAATFYIKDISDAVDEVGREIRTMWASHILKSRIRGIWDTLYPEELGVMLLSDCVMMDHITGKQYSLFLYEKLMLCCGETSSQDKVSVTRYPIYAWQLGPALSQKSSLKIIHIIPTSQFVSLHCIDVDHFEITWRNGSNLIKAAMFYTLMPLQNEQWISALQPLIPHVYYSDPVIDTDSVFSWISEEEEYRRRSLARPWSVIGRKGTRSESSSIILKDFHDHASYLSPGLLPTLFSSAPQSPLSLNNRPLDVPDICIHEPTFASLTSEMLDLTGKILKESRYPSAHGGYSDVWKCIWQTETSEITVAVKVIRQTTRDPEMEGKLLKRLEKELEIWKKLNHPNILELYGIVSGFGPYISMVCPWLKNGNVSKYMEKCGDILSMEERLKLLCGVAGGLSYLHSFSIIHGDLTGSNVLIDDDGNGCLCDFGLSNIAAEFQDSSSISSTIAGSVRWADARLFQGYEDENIPAISKWSDIYSFGSVMLEVLSGRMPYHYLRTDALVIVELHRGNKPRRPAHNFVNDEQWDLIQKCWDDVPTNRPVIDEVFMTIQSLLANTSK